MFFVVFFFCFWFGFFFLVFVVVVFLPFELQIKEPYDINRLQKIRMSNELFLLRKGLIDNQVGSTKLYLCFTIKVATCSILFLSIF